MPVPSIPLAAIRQPAFLFTADGRVAEANDLAEALAGRPLAGLSIADVASIFGMRPPGGTPDAPAELPVSRALRGEEAVDVPLAITAADGRVLRVLATASPIRSGDVVSGALVIWQDVTALMAAEGGMRESEAKYRMLFDSIDEGFFLIDVLFDDHDRPVDLHYVEANAAATRMLGLDYTGRRLTELSPDYEEYWFEIFGTVARTGESVRLERYAAPDRRWYDFYVFKVGGPESRRIGNTFLDITERKRTEEAIAAAKRERQNIIDNTPAIVYAFDLEERFIVANAAVAETFHATPEEMIGRRRLEFMPAEDADWHETNDRRVIEAGRALEFEEYSQVGDRTITWLTTKFPLRDARGEIYAVAGISSEITERKRAEEALRRSEGRLVEAQRLAKVGDWEWDLATGAVIWSRETYALFGRGSELPAPRFYDEQPGYFTPESWARLGAAVQGAIEADEPYDLEIEAIREDGAHRWLTARGEGVRDDSGAVAQLRGTVQDITERRRIEEELRRAHRHSALLLESISDSFLAIDRDWRLTYINKRALDYRHFSPGEVIGRSLWEVFPEIVGTPLETFYRSAMESGEPIAFENRSAVAAGKTFELHSYPSDEGLSIFGQDVTERKRAEAALEASEALFREQVEKAGSIILRFDTNGRITYINPFAERFFGYGAGELVGRDAVGTIIPEKDSITGGDLSEMVREIVRSPERFRENENENIKKNGERVRVRWTNRPILGPDGTVREFLAIGMDITEARLAQAALAGVNRILSAALTSATEEELGETCLAVATEITQSRFGYFDELDEGGLLHDIAISDPGWEACAMTDQTGHRRRPGTFILRGLYGRVIEEGRSLIANDPPGHPDAVGIPPGHPSLTAFLGVPLLRDGATVGMIGVANREGGYSEIELRLLEAIAPAIVDAFQRFRAGQDLRRYARDLERSNADLERFAYVSSHDLQEPLRSIVSFSQLLERKYRGRLDAEADEYITFIVEGGNRMQTLILDLLAYARINTAGSNLHPIDAEDVLAAVERALALPLREAGAVFVHDPMPTVLADPLQLEQVFENLILNAIKFRRRDVPLRVHVGARRVDGFWEFSVADNGIGIEEVYYDRIFVIFQRLHTKDAYEGTGIGLAIVKRIVDRHGGTVRVESTPGEGTIFFFTLPAA
jgi:PAS domain S-box-containing protein